MRKRAKIEGEAEPNWVCCSAAFTISQISSGNFHAFGCLRARSVAYNNVRRRLSRAGNRSIVPAYKQYLEKKQSRSLWTLQYFPFVGFPRIISSHLGPCTCDPRLTCTLGSVWWKSEGSHCVEPVSDSENRANKKGRSRVLWGPPIRSVCNSSDIFG